MIPPIPASLVPVTAHQDTAKPRPEILPVTPVEQSANESGVALDKRHPQDIAERERRRRQGRGADAELAGEGEQTAPAAEVEEGEATTRLGSHVDITV
ncbi:aspartate-semialdehyde dehydrogenase [Stutzerimonas tarimensis]|uniref:Aspartate-semialdehyde dehydrogenase n=1 Tax=Stutzerimonas tarimensis TaxID=1507735 RepID=A0ABV7T8Q1_9GAMM